MRGLATRPAALATMTTAPPASSIRGAAARVIRYAPVRLTSRMCRHASTSCSSARWRTGETPAALTSTAGVPKRSTKAATARSQAAWSETSATSARPRSPISAATASHSPAVRTTTPTDAPSAARASAIDRPRPRPPPVTRHARPAKRVPLGDNRLVEGRFACEAVDDGRLGPGHRFGQAGDDTAALQPRGRVVHGQDERVLERFLNRRLLLALGVPVVAGRLRLVVEDLVPRLDDLVLDVVEDVAADAGRALGRLDKDVHRALGVAARHLADDAGRDLLRSGQLEVEQPQRPLRVQPVDEVLDVLGGVLLAHQPGDRVLELTPVDHDRGRAREAVVLAGVVDVKVGVQDPADVLRLQAVAPELALQPLLLGDVAGHPESGHDLRAARPGVDEDRVVPAEDQVPPRGRPRRNAHVAAEDEKAGFELDVDQVEDFDLESYGSSFESCCWFYSASVVDAIRSPLCLDALLASTD